MFVTDNLLTWTPSSHAVSWKEATNTPAHTHPLTLTRAAKNPSQDHTSELALQELNKRLKQSWSFECSLNRILNRILGSNLKDPISITSTKRCCTKIETPEELSKLTSTQSEFMFFSARPLFDRITRLFSLFFSSIATDTSTHHAISQVRNQVLDRYGLCPLEMKIFGKGSDTMGRRYPMGNGNTVWWWSADFSHRQYDSTLELL